MDILFQILFFASVFLIFHSYILFPLLLKLKARNKKLNSLCYTETEDLPAISILLAVYNEEKVIAEKIRATFNTDYPLDKIEFLIGSDNSNDRTNEIIENFQKQFPQIKLFQFKTRKGKSSIINQLKKEADNELLILTDAKVIFRRNTIFELIKHFKNEKINIVGGVLKNMKKNNFDISVQEDAYMNREMQIKYEEGLAYRASMGVFGAIYAIRKKDLPDIPPHFLTDDFYVSLKVLENKGQVIFEKNAVGEEQLTGRFDEEFRRKNRIASGNFQNLFALKSIFYRPFSGVFYCYFSHKVLRWSGPFIIIISLIFNILLAHITFYKISLFIFIFSFTIPFFDFLLKKINIHIKIMRYFTHFYGMNLALLSGFFKFMKGVKSAAWEPSKRN